jgi:hypothetical protein
MVQANVHISCREHDTASLARAMRVSAATASRIVAQLRRELAGQGIEMVTVRKGRKWHYEIRDEEHAREAMQRLVDMAGFIKGDGPILRPGETVDDVVYGVD